MKFGISFLVILAVASIGRGQLVRFENVTTPSAVSREMIPSSAARGANVFEPDGYPQQVVQAKRWEDWRPFLGTWQGVGGGEPGQGKGDFTFQTELQGVILTRHSYSEYPATKDKPAYRHDDLMIVYAGPSDKTSRADYWDNEDHVIHYDVEFSDGKLVFLSDVSQPGPRYRLTYVKTGEDTLKLTFEIAPPKDRDNFRKYIEASARRVSTPSSRN